MEPSDHSSRPPSHSCLQGMPRLCHVVDSLDQNCPWTRTMSASQMLTWLRGEIDELAEEIKDTKKATTQEEEQKAARKRAIVSEMGDILFDALMLDMMVRREFGIEKNATWDAAAEKVERRTPYMKEWGDGNIQAHTTEEAEFLWQAVKREEKRQLKEHGRVLTSNEDGFLEKLRDGLEEKRKNDTTTHNITVIPATPEHSDTLWCMLTSAASMTGDRDQALAEAKTDSFLCKHVEDWGTKSGDTGVIAQDQDGRHVGAAWVRRRFASDQDSVFVGDDRTFPKLAIGVLPEARGKGVGTLLMEGLIESLRRSNGKGIVLSVREENKGAIRLYNRLGFVKTGEHINRVGGKSIAMRIEFTPASKAI